MADEKNVYATVLNYFTNEFTAINERLKRGQFDNYKERVVVSQKITDAINLLSPYVRSDAQTRLLVRNGESLKKDLLSVRDVITSQAASRWEQPALMKALMIKSGKSSP